MKKLDVNFPIPDYVLEEINKYLYWKDKGKDKIMQWENIKTLMVLSFVNGKLSKEQINIIKNEIENKE